VVASLSVILLGVINGIVVAIALSILLFFRRNWWPHGEVLGKAPSGNWHSVRDQEAAQQVPGVVVFRWEAPLFFANAGIFRRQVRSLVRHDIEWIVLQCEAVTDIDVTAADMLEALTLQLEKQGVHLAFGELRARLREQMHRYGLFDTPEREQLFSSLDAAIEAIAADGPTAPEPDHDHDPDPEPDHGPGHGPDHDQEPDRDHARDRDPTRLHPDERGSS
jgi:MFS superfamily sulfate permease-like transporter